MLRLLLRGNRRAAQSVNLIFSSAAPQCSYPHIIAAAVAAALAAAAKTAEPQPNAETAKPEQASR